MYEINTEAPQNNLTISNIFISHECYLKGNLYNTNFNVSIASNGFSGISLFECDVKSLVQFVHEIKSLYDFKYNNVELNDTCYGSRIIFELKKTGHITISGTIYANAMLNSLNFEFTTDQTMLKKFVDSLYRDFIVENLYKLEISP